MRSVVSECPKCGYHNQDGFPKCPECRFPLMIVAGKYRLERLIGQGGMGQVYLAQHIHLDFDTERVVKVLPPNALLSETTRKRFRREVQLTSALSQRNEHIVRIYDDFGEEPGLGHYYVMEYLRGQPLTQFMPRGTGLSDSITFHIFFQLCFAMDAAHRAKVVHRDLKPGNIFLMQRDQDEHFVKVIDFGVARSDNTEREHTQITQGSVGTPAYMSPEQCDNLPVDGRSDLYAMGIILFEMLSGYNPYGLDSRQEETPPLFVALTAHIAQQPESIRQWRPDLDPQFDAFFSKALAKHPEERFADVHAFWDALRPITPGALQLPPLQRFASFSFATTKPTRSHKPHQDSADTREKHPHTRRPWEDLLQPDSQRRSLWSGSLLLLLILGLAAGSFWWWKSAQNKQPTTLTKAEQRPKATPRAPGHVSAVGTSRKMRPRQTPLAQQPQDRRERSSPPVRHPPKRNTRPARRSVARHNKVHRRRSDRVQKILERRRVLRRSRKRRKRGPCGANSARYRWIFSKVGKPRNIRASIDIMNCRGCLVRQKRGGYCLRVLRSLTSLWIRIHANGYQSCRSRLRTEIRSFQWHLKEIDPDDLGGENYRCIRNIR